MIISSRKQALPSGGTMRTARNSDFVLAVLFLAAATTIPAADIGPSNGSLVVAGGGVKNPAIYERFVALAGGPEAPIVVIPTAGTGETYARAATPARRRRGQPRGAPHPRSS
jgi:1,6-anhydro-N-acetylmuramate kinase